MRYAMAGLMMTLALGVATASAPGAEAASIGFGGAARPLSDLGMTSRINEQRFATARATPWRHARRRRDAQRRYQGNLVGVTVSPTPYGVIPPRAQIGPAPAVQAPPPFVPPAAQPFPFSSSAATSYCQATHRTYDAATNSYRGVSGLNQACP